jgi:predicted  nucleic acid-binding Zn-ribbon protein
MEVQMSDIKEQVDKNSDNIDRLEVFMKTMFVEMNKNLIAYREYTDKNIREMKENTDKNIREMKENTDKNIMESRNEMREFKDEMKEFREDVKADIKNINKQWGHLALKMGTLVETV